MAYKFYVYIYSCRVGVFFIDKSVEVGSPNCEDVSVFGVYNKIYFASTLNKHSYVFNNCVSIHISDVKPDPQVRKPFAHAEQSLYNNCRIT